MRFGASFFMQNYGDWDRYAEKGYDRPPARADWEIYDEGVHLANLVEPLGFDSIWTVEHHFTPYTMVPNSLQFLTYMAGRTERVDFGTMVVVLPWHDPIRVAEEVAMLDVLL
ncbi:MAG: LLM class flavin-dependent oxidoreductase, partial [Acidimicrobiia bacterium]|nr:LLM class flavin-dependent oxidoreductase [Acidimicrobiia bacterium]